jgi:hypothetical protein
MTMRFGSVLWVGAVLGRMSRLLLVSASIEPVVGPSGLGRLPISFSFDTNWSSDGLPSCGAAGSRTNCTTTALQVLTNRSSIVAEPRGADRRSSNPVLQEVRKLAKCPQHR